jgi:prolyl-tRNA synthetase
MAEQEGLTAKKKEFSEWYVQAVKKAELADYSPVSGFAVIRPYGYALWENIQTVLDKKFKDIGIKNAYFPLLIPENILQKEKEHVKGFSPEVAWVTEAGKSKLNERLAIRPTSETIIYDSYKKWIRSWRELPLKINQWCNVVRWEKSDPRLFLRGREFLWQEGHTAFATKQDAEKETSQIVEIYKNVTEDHLAIPCTIGKKTRKETFAGAEYTIVLEYLMPDGRIIQGPDFHYDGQNFSKAFDITFLDKKGKKQHVYQNTWGFSTRQIGIMVGLHGDDKGLIIPPKIAPIQMIIVPIFDIKTKGTVIKDAEKLKKTLEKKGFRVSLDSREEYTPGWKFNYYELRGIPIRLEMGEREIKSKQIVVMRRDTLKRETVKVKELNRYLEKLLDTIQKNLFTKAEKFLNDHTKKVKSYDEFKKHLEGNRILACWCGDQKCEDKIKEETGAKTSCIPLKKISVFSNCVYCGNKGKHALYFGKSY